MLRSGVFSKQEERRHR